jgi:hypothetical protein
MILLTQRRLEDLEHALYVKLREDIRKSGEHCDSTICINGAYEKMKHVLEFERERLLERYDRRIRDLEDMVEEQRKRIEGLIIPHELQAIGVNWQLQKKAK